MQGLNTISELIAAKHATCPMCQGSGKVASIRRGETKRIVAQLRRQFGVCTRTVFRWMSPNVTK